MTAWQPSPPLPWVVPAAAPRDQIVHAWDGNGQPTLCCGKTPGELPIDALGTYRPDLVTCTASPAAPEADDCGHHSWAGLMALLDEHWPEDVFPTREDDAGRDAGARIVSLLRRVDEQAAEAERLRETVARVEALHDRLLTIAHDSESLTAVVYRQNADRLRRALDGNDG